jgi:hypothetical protein
VRWWSTYPPPPWSRFDELDERQTSYSTDDDEDEAPAAIAEELGPGMGWIGPWMATEERLREPEPTGGIVRTSGGGGCCSPGPNGATAGSSAFVDVTGPGPPRVAATAVVK